MAPDHGYFSYFGPAVKFGSKGAAVRWIQERLLSFGFDVGEVDGFFGIYTQEAVKAFQRAYNLRVDGKVGPRTRRVLAYEDVPKTVMMVRNGGYSDIGSKTVYP